MIRHKLDVEGVSCDILLANSQDSFEAALTRESFRQVRTSASTWSLRLAQNSPPADRGPAWASTVCCSFGGLETAALQLRINPIGGVRPQPGVGADQRVNLDAGQIPPLFTQGLERSPRGASKLKPQVLVRQEAADDSFNRSM
jgi:hypothetical protein